MLTGKAAFGDWKSDAPGVRRRISINDLPEPYATHSATEPPHIIWRPADQWPKVPPGFRVDLFAQGLKNPRLIRTAPNGDVFVAESWEDRIRVLRSPAGASRAQRSEVFASGLNLPFGIGFYPPGPDPQYLYVANTGSVVRFPYKNGALHAPGAAQMVVPDLPDGWHILRGGGHWTRDLAFSKDGRAMFVSVGSSSNDYEGLFENETRRADILEFRPDGSAMRTYASGIRNPVGIAIDPRTGELWASVNERDGLGDDLPPDYITRVVAGGFYGWPWFYIGPHQDPVHRGEHPELRDKVLLPDVLLQAHSASLEMTFYTGTQFPKEYVGDAFAAEHGSWNRSTRTGYKVIRIPQHNAVPIGEYQDFMTGFVTSGGRVWGRPVGVTVAADGALLVSDDASNSIWRVAYQGK